MNQHIEIAKEIRDTKGYNCAQTIVAAYKDEIGITEEMAINLASNFGSGMKRGSTCGAITGGLIVLGALGISNPNDVNYFFNSMKEKHNGLTNCKDLLSKSFEEGIPRKTHCDGLIFEAIELIDEIIENN